MSEAVDSLWQRVNKTAGCWLWTGPTSKGYGRFRRQMVHRLAYEELIGPIPEGLTLDHLCRVRNCVRPNHLEPVTNRENTLRGFGATAVNARKTHCPQGHAYTPENTRWYPTGRHCRSCEPHYRELRHEARMAHNREYKARTHEARMAQQRVYRARKRAEA